MQIVIPTRGRVELQQTVMNLPQDLYSKTHLFCPEHEADVLKNRWPDINVVAQPDPNMPISEKRGWIKRTMHEQGVEKILMLDDDLFFYVRREDVPDRLRDAGDADILQWFSELEERLTPDSPHGGFGPRQGNHTQPGGWVVGRMMLALGYYLPTVMSHCEFGRVRTREDLDVCLQLLRAGFPNSVTHEFVVGQKAYAAPGGCENERTVESSNDDAYQLAALHPGFVSVVDRNYKNVPRKEVVVQWKKAFSAGTQRRASP